MRMNKQKQDIYLCIRKCKYRNAETERETERQIKAGRERDTQWCVSQENSV